MINKIIKSIKTTILTLLVTTVLATAMDTASLYPTDQNISVFSEELPSADKPDGIN